MYISGLAITDRLMLDTVVDCDSYPTPFRLRMYQHIDQLMLGQIRKIESLERDSMKAAEAAQDIGESD